VCVCVRVCSGRNVRTSGLELRKAVYSNQYGLMDLEIRLFSYVPMKYAYVYAYLCIIRSMCICEYVYVYMYMHV